MNIKCWFGHQWGSFQVKPYKIRKCVRCKRMQQYVYDGYAPYWQNFSYTQTTFVYCPVCKQELISSGSYIHDKELVRYKCTKCKTVSDWDFDAPTPILIKAPQALSSAKATGSNKASRSHNQEKE